MSCREEEPRAEEVSSVLRVQGPNGLHLRAAAEIVTLVNTFNAHVLLECGSERADAHSVLSIVCLGAAQGTRIRVRASGVDAKRVIDALAGLFANRFEDEICTPGPDVSGHPIPPSVD